MLKNECTRNCWLAAAVAGLLVWLFNIFGGLFFGGLLLGLITFFLLGKLLVWGLCSGRGGLAESAEVLGPKEAAAHSTPEADGGVLDRAETAIVNASLAFAAGTVAAVEKGREALREKPEAGHDDDSLLDRVEDRLEAASEKAMDAMSALAARGKAAHAVPGSDDAPGATGPAALQDGGLAAASASGQSGSDEVAPSGRAAIPTPAADAAPKAAKGGAGKATAEKPAKKAGGGSAKPAKKKPAPQDNLKEIKGIGPQLESLLHEAGVTSFAQIAGWSDADIDHFAGLIGRMGGRIRSDDWVAQAKLLAAGGETEFSARVDKGEVY